ncbi:DUF1801 domain-containing protein [Pedobacter nutrimenti]|uniref:DUF1801 domain-containing protein n=1 Tax=Pedobacter nutrimenti TaxID=1241337 RepID=UPI00292D16BE|nr:DUF1801 domain-containing protein [Pedobacter nutrimenti]
MAKNKTSETTASIRDFLEKINDPVKRKDSYVIAALMEKQSGFEPKMWGTAIVGFGSYHYRYESGHEGDAPLIAFSPRSNAISLYMASDFEAKEKLLQQLGKHKTGKSCIYIKKIEDVNLGVLIQLIDHSLVHMKRLYPES